PYRIRLRGRQHCRLRQRLIPPGSATSQTFLRNAAQSEPMTHLPEDGSSGSQPSFDSPVYTPPTAPVQARTRASRPWIPLVVIALVVGMLSGSFSAVAIPHLLQQDAN